MFQVSKFDFFFENLQIIFVLGFNFFSTNMLKDLEDLA
jgi:hypothetical protein